MVLANSACGGLAEPVDPYHCSADYCVGGEATGVAYGNFAPSSVDLLIVIDDAVPSGAGSAPLAQGLREMIANLADFMANGAWGLDLSVAITRAAPPNDSSPSDLWPVDPTCAQPKGPFLHATQVCDVASNFAGDLSEAVACAATHMMPSGAPPRPMDAVHAALAPASGFRRAGASLFVVVVSSQDDPGLLGADQRAAQHDFLASMVGDPAVGLTLGIVAPASAVGLSSFVGYFDGNAAFSRLEDSTWPAIASTTNDFGWHEWWPACLDWPVVDADPATDGLQPP